ncbi:response regulator transcription factor [Azoarcus sp. DN11]|uniref:response regulator n=1 Tax=Azoarcus sp. DN11 TaxID=356837 RepID=UPI000EAD3D3E|nr:response regulator transcription factor [Azoarcus sp. DN11]AYH43289.1 DNA-binding response regulator [Azoarcus sp. DN11]
MASVLENLRLILADDHTIVRMGFRMLLEGAGACIVAETDSGEGALSAFAEHQPDVLVMDVTMPGIGGLGALERLLARHPGARVLMLSAHEDSQIPMRALRSGATGYLSKRAQPQELVRAVAQVARGQRYVDPELAPQLALAQFGGSNDPADALTDKEFAVFLQLAKGSSVNQVADTHKLSPSTVGTHLYHIKQKLNAANAAELALIAVRSGLIEA